MGRKSSVFLAALFCCFATDYAEVHRKFGQNFLKGGASGDDRDAITIDMVAKVWNYCTEKFIDLDLGLFQASADSHGGIEFDSSLLAKTIIQNAIANLHIENKELVLDCLRENHLPISNEHEIVSNRFVKLFLSWMRIPIRYLRQRHRVSETASSPAPALSEELSPTPVFQPPERAPKQSPVPSPRQSLAPTPTQSLAPTRSTKFLALFPTQLLVLIHRRSLLPTPKQSPEWTPTLAPTSTPSAKSPALLTHRRFLSPTPKQFPVATPKKSPAPNPKDPVPTPKNTPAPTPSTESPTPTPSAESPTLTPKQSPTAAPKESPAPTPKDPTPTPNNAPASTPTGQSPTPTPSAESPALTSKQSPAPTPKDRAPTPINTPAPTLSAESCALNAKQSPAPAPTSPAPSPTDVGTGSRGLLYKQSLITVTVITSVFAVVGLIAMIWALYPRRRRVEALDVHTGLRRPHLDTDDAPAGFEGPQTISTPNHRNSESPPANARSSHAESNSAEANNAESDGKAATIPLPPGQRAAPAPPRPPPGPPPCPPKPPAAPPPPPPPKVGHTPKPKTLPSSGGGTAGGATAHSDKAKLKPFFWDKVAASPNRSMVWHQIKAGSFEIDEEQMKDLFGYVPSNDHNKNHRRKDSTVLETPQFVQIIDNRKSQNLAILLKASGVTMEDIFDALRKGNELPAELCQSLLRMAPTKDEELKLREYDGDITHLGPAEQFLRGLIDVPFAFKRLQALLFKSTFQEEISTLKENFKTVELACKDLTNSRLFLKLLEAVLKTGNRLNDGTYRGGATAFKLDTLLKLSDVKGTDGKTTLLHFVVREISRSEGAKAARRSKQNKSNKSKKYTVPNSSPEIEEYYQSLGLQMVSGLGHELKNVRKASIIDNQTISATVAKLRESLFTTKEFLDNEMKNVQGECVFHDNLANAVKQSESDIKWLTDEHKRIMDLVKSTGSTFHGNAGKDEGLRLFAVIADFLTMLDKACNDIKQSSKFPSKATKYETPSSSGDSSNESKQPESLVAMRQRLFPSMKERQMSDESSSDDES